MKGRGRARLGWRDRIVADLRGATEGEWTECARDKTD